MTWFYFMCVLSITIIITDHNGTLEPALNRFEERIGIRTVLPDDTTETAVPYYIPPITKEVDSTRILPDSRRRD